MNHDRVLARAARLERTLVERFLARVSPEPANLVRRIRDDYEHGGVTQGDLANRYGVSRATIGRALTFESWAHLDTRALREGAL